MARSAVVQRQVDALVDDVLDDSYGRCPTLPKRELIRSGPGQCLHPLSSRIRAARRHPRAGRRLATRRRLIWSTGRPIYLCRSVHRRTHGTQPECPRWPLAGRTAAPLRSARQGVRLLDQRYDAGQAAPASAPSATR